MIHNLNTIISSYISNKSADYIAIESFVSSVAGALVYVFPTVSFYLYTLTSSIFRQELRSMLRSLFFCKWSINNRRVEPTVGSFSLQTISTR